jgi:putative pyruvate formate lyase activating enzyme
MGEEAPLVPSGTIFFAGCNFGPCVFCQNWDISNNPDNGEVVTPEKLARIVNSLKREGARNVNWVGGEPTPNAYHIIASMKYTTVNIAQLWNSNMYCSKELMKLLLDIIDFWLPDFKYGSDECAKRLSKVPNYWSIVSRNHKMAYDETVAQGTSGMIIRHLVLPNHIECCTRPILEWIAENCPKALVNIMEQYRPLFQVPGNPKYSDIDRRPSGKEMEKAYKIADKLNILWKPVS